MKSIEECYDLLIQKALSVAVCPEEKVEDKVKELRNFKDSIEYIYGIKVGVTHALCSYITYVQNLNKSKED